MIRFGFTSQLGIFPGPFSRPAPKAALKRTHSKRFAFTKHRFQALAQDAQVVNERGTSPRKVTHFSVTKIRPGAQEKDSGGNLIAFGLVARKKAALKRTHSKRFAFTKRRFQTLAQDV